MSEYAKKMQGMVDVYQKMGDKGLVVTSIVIIQY